MNRIATATLSAELRNSLKIALMLMLAVTVMALTGCDDSPSEVEDYDPEPILTALLHTGEPVDHVILERVGGFYSYYDTNELGIVNASVKLFPVLEANGSEADTTGRVCYFNDDPTRNGYYIPTGNYVPEAKVRYRIEVLKASEDVEMWAETTVPDTFSLDIYQAGQLVDVDGDTMNRAMPDMFWRWSEAEAAGGYQLGILALDDREDLVPLDPDFDPTDEDQVEAYEEAPKYSYTVAPDYQQSLTVSWFYFIWGGPTRIEVKACSDEYYDYYFSSLTLQGSENPLMNVHGGLGIFGATMTNSIEIYMEVLEP